MSAYVDLTKILPEKEKGGFAVRHFALTEKEVSIAKLHSAIHGRGEDTLGLEADRVYTKLISLPSGNIIMSNTPMEMRTNEKFVRYAHGNVLVGGLGLGMVLTQAGKKVTVEKIVVIEKEQAIIDLVWQHILPTMMCKAAVHCGDVFKYKGEIYLKYDHKFNVIYFDIWPDISPDNWGESKRLKRIWRPLLVNRESPPKPWMSSWREDTVRHLAENDRRKHRLHNMIERSLKRAI